VNTHILFTARDIGAAHQIKHIINAFISKGIKASVVASGEAYNFLEKERVRSDLFSLDNRKAFVPRNSPEELLGELLESSREIILKKQPDAVFCGLATLGFGIDEAVLYWTSSERLNIPSFQFIDTWGTFNHLRDGYPDLYFAIDKASEKLGNMGAKAPIQVVGSPKHFAYLSKPLDTLREVTRERLGIEENEKLVGYFGQDPEIPGHTFNFRVMVQAIQGCKYNEKKCKFLIRPHPGYKDKYEVYWKYLKDMCIDAIIPSDEFSVEEVLCACDIVSTCFSTVGVDHAYLSCSSEDPIGVVIYLLCGSEIKDHLLENFGYWKIPLLEEGIGLFVEEQSQMLNKIEYVFSNPLAVTDYFKATKSLNLDYPCEKIIDTVLSFVP
jgi:hypothetical protein